MNNGTDSYTIEELAAYLKVSKLTVYDMVKRGDISSYRVGRQIRVDSGELSRYKVKAKEWSRQPLQTLAVYKSSVVRTKGTSRPLIIHGEDISLDLIAQCMEKSGKIYRPLRSYGGSLDGLVSLYRREADMAGCHLLDMESGEYNIPFVKRLLAGSPVLAIRLMQQYAGVYVQKGNPLSIRQWSDLVRPEIRFLNRNSGSGSRILVDAAFREMGIVSARILEESSHLGAALQVANGLVDAAVGIESVAYLANVDFVPLVKEKHDLVMLRTQGNLDWIEEVVAIIRSQSFRGELSVIPGYDLTESGCIVYEATS